MIFYGFHSRRQLTRFFLPYTGRLVFVLKSCGSYLFSIQWFNPIFKSINLACCTSYFSHRAHRKHREKKSDYLLNLCASVNSACPVECEAYSSGVRNNVFPPTGVLVFTNPEPLNPEPMNGYTGLISCLSCLSQRSVDPAIGAP